MIIEIFKESNTTIGFLSGKLNTETVPIVKKELDLATGPNCEKLILNLKNLEYVSLAGLQLFLMLAKKMSERNCEFILQEVNENIMELLEATGFDQIFHID